MATRPAQETLPVARQRNNVSVPIFSALGQDVKITVKPTRKEQGEMEVVVG